MIIEIDGKWVQMRKMRRSGSSDRSASREDVTGQKFGNLTAIRWSRHDGRFTLWLMRCDCGNEKEIKIAHAKRGKTVSCGCVNKAKILTDEQRAQYKVWMSYKEGARKRNLEWSLTKEEAYRVLDGDCYYCGSKAVDYKSPRTAKFIRKSNGIDRKDNKQGYKTDNVLSCCYLCNKMKSDLGYEEFLLKIKQINSHLKID